ncbi:unnamed protein product [Urochloa decumbens]|uniref:Receptor kinase-like protein Xa21 n=1 Tax=Urochloa decumbens TaxID=240449 RepID=A0ABC9BLD6_9POAL
MALLEYLLLAFISLACPASAATLNTHTSSLTAPGASTPNVADYLALMSFKSFIRGDPTRALSPWGNLSVPMCYWSGVACGSTGRRLGRVVALDLAELNLLGTITPALGNLTYLRRLNLPWNRFYGILPPELGNLQELKHLNLSLNSMGGQIPQSLSNCSHLVNISLNDNMLQGPIPRKFSSLHNLKVLELVQNRLIGTFPPEFGSLESLTLLNVEHNNLTGPIPGEIGKLVNLVTLGLGHNQFSGTIPPSVGNLSKLTFLTVFSNSLIGSIPPLQGLSSLSVLHIGKNKLTGCIPPSIGNISSLTAIDVYQNDLDGQIPQSLGNLEMLTYLGLDANNLFGHIPHSLGNLRSLEKVYLSYNGLEGELPPTVFNLSNLEYLMMDHNLINGSLPSDMSINLPKLKYFSITYNRLHGIVPSYICNCSMLVLFQTTSNLLSGTIPQCLGIHQKSLDAVSMGGNQFQATTDADWGFLSSLTNSTYLTLLDISYNNLQGVLPHSVGNLSKQLLYFLAGGNKFTGRIPEGLGDLVNLEFLSMEENLLEGSIPTSVGKMSKLSTLGLENNKLSGFIPPTLGNLTNLGSLTLQGNTFGGVIPSSLSSCPLAQLDLSYNFLEGRIPKELFLIRTFSDSLLINHNLLSGRLPSEIGNLQNLGAFDFSDNMISGEIPTSIGGCQSLQYLNTSGNILQGEIPSSLGELKGLIVLDLSHNNLSGRIPEFLGNLRGLSSLNLSFNKFEGQVPQDGVFLNATEISITGDDSLCGGIPQLKLPPCSKSKHTAKKSSHNVAIIVSICSAFLFVILIFALSKFYQMTWNTNSSPEWSVINEYYKRVSYAELANATNNFALENLIGAGSFGSVYKAKMRGDGQHVVVAVKVLNLMQRGAPESFVAECETLKCARHRNLVQILTVCSSIDFQGRDFKALLYKFLPNGNLDQWLHQNDVKSGEQNALNLITRLRIAIDVASSLDYLHEYKPTPIIHCDLKPSNILLDSDMVAHVGDFGLARFLHQSTDESSGWASMRGSIGYAAPEYGLGNEVSTHGDVYSYGVLLLEMFTGKRPLDNNFREAIGLRNYVQMALPNRVGIIVDQQLLKEIDDGNASTSNSNRIRDLRIDCIASILQVGISCSEETPMNRPTIGHVLRELQAIGNKFGMHLYSDGVSSIC